MADQDDAMDCSMEDAATIATTNNDDDGYAHMVVVPHRPAVYSPTTIVWERRQSRSGRYLSTDSSPPRSSRVSQFFFPAATTAQLPQASLGNLPEDLLAYTACYLNVGSLKQARLVNRKFNLVLSSDKAGWKEHWQRLQASRCHVTWPTTTISASSMSAKDAYRLACADARLRHSLQLSELIFQPTNNWQTSTVWSFRFKQVAGAEWTAADPWHQGLGARQMVFLANGSVRQVQVLADGTLTLHPAFWDAPNLRGGLDIGWRFVSQPIDLPKKELGAYVRLTIAGRDVPTYVVHRSPLGNWSFIMENCWGVFSSSPLPTKVMRHDTAVQIPRLRLRRDSNGGARWFNVSDDDDDDEDEEDEQQQETTTTAKRNLLEDSSLSVTCRWQWREALLYNLGASILPDGPNATADFDRAWQLSMRSMHSYGFPTATAEAEAEAAAARNNYGGAAT